MSSNEKVGNVFGDRKKEVITTPLSEKKSLTKDVEKGTDKLAYIKQGVNTIHRKGLDQFEGQSSGSKGWFKLDIEFFLTTFYKSNSEFYKALLKKELSLR